MDTGRVVFHLDKIDSFKLNNEISKLQWFGQEIAREFETNDYTLIVYSQLTNLLIAFQKEFVIFQLFALLFITPIVGMSLSLTSYSANLMKRRQKRQVSSMLQRGSSRKEVIFVLTIQVVELTITALLLALVIGYAFSWLINQSTGFLNFSGASEYPVINMSIYYIVIVAGFILSLIINAKNIWQLSTITTHEAYSEHHVKIPLWERLYLDIVLIALGLILWFIVLTQLEGKAAYAFAYGFGTTAIVFIILGSILLATRLFPILIKTISNFAWKSDKAGIIGIAAKRSSRRRSDVTRSLVLITLTFTLIFSSIITIQSYQGHDRENAYYQIGSDILVRNVDFESNATKLAVLGVEGVDSATYLTMTSQLITYICGARIQRTSSVK
ncbi:MAG: FtsX-like permease family protein [Candidatus Heimdallarchaeota archaeon]